MLRLESDSLRVELLDPSAPAEQARQGTRYAWGGYVWQVHDRRLGALLSGPEYPHPTPTPFNGQGLPESFRHRRRDGTPLTWSGATGLGPGIGVLSAADGNTAVLALPCVWTITSLPDRFVFATRQAAAGLACEVAREIVLQDRQIHSWSRLTNVGERELRLQWFAHPFWPLRESRSRIRLPVGTTVAENPAFAIAANGELTFKRPFTAEDDSHFALLALPPGRPLELSLDHPKLTQVTFATSFVPDECPVWANSRTVSVEPYLDLRLAPGETRQWHVRHGFEA